MITKRVRWMVAAGALLLALAGAPATGSVAFAQEGAVTAEPQTQTAQPADNNDDGFPWGLLGLLGLGGLAGFNRRDNTRTVETVDASRRR